LAKVAAANESQAHKAKKMTIGSKQAKARAVVGLSTTYDQAEAEENKYSQNASLVRKEKFDINRSERGIHTGYA